MATAHWWFTCHIDDAEFQLLEPAFRSAEELALPSALHLSALEFWRNTPDCFDGYELTPESAELINDFILGFNLPGFDDLARAVCHDAGEFGTLLTEKKCFRFCMIDRRTPVSVLFRALGYERAARLPGRYGNLLLHRTAVAPALASVADAYAGTE